MSLFYHFCAVGRYAVATSEDLITSSGATVSTKTSSLTHVGDASPISMTQSASSKVSAAGKLFYYFGYQLPSLFNPHQETAKSSNSSTKLPFTLARFEPTPFAEEEGEEDREREKIESSNFEFAILLHSITYIFKNNSRSRIDFHSADFHNLLPIIPNTPPRSNLHLTRLFSPDTRTNITFAAAGTTLRSQEAYVTPQSTYLWIKHTLIPKASTTSDENVGESQSKELPQRIRLNTVLCSKGDLKVADNPPPNRDPFIGFHYDATMSAFRNNKKADGADRNVKETQKKKKKRKEGASWRFHGYLVWSPWLRLNFRRYLLPLHGPVITKVPPTKQKRNDKKKHPADPSEGLNLFRNQNDIVCSSMYFESKLPRRELSSKTSSNYDVTLLWGIGLGLGAVPPLIENWVATLISIISVVVGLGIAGVVGYFYGKEFWKKRQRRGGRGNSTVHRGLRHQIEEALGNGVHVDRRKSKEEAKEDGGNVSGVKVRPNIRKDATPGTPLLESFT